MWVTFCCAYIPEMFKFRNMVFVENSVLDIFKADSRFALSQWETSLQSNTVSHWLGANLESVLILKYTNAVLAQFPDAIHVVWLSTMHALRWFTTRKQKWCQFLENLHKYSLKYIGFNHAKQIMGYHVCFWDILPNITYEIETKPHIITHLG